jgi:hypothetical protein
VSGCYAKRNPNNHGKPFEHIENPAGYAPLAAASEWLSIAASRFKAAQPTERLQLTDALIAYVEE